MSTEDCPPVTQAPGRYPCAWCALPNAWPDGCSEIDNPPGDIRFCDKEIEQRCMTGDHRRCAVDRCVVAARWHDPVRAVGIAVARGATRGWAVVSTIPNDVIVVGTVVRLDEAEEMLRTALRNAGRDPEDPEGRGVIYIVRATDGAFL